MPQMANARSRTPVSGKHSYCSFPQRAAWCANCDWSTRAPANIGAAENLPSRCLEQRHSRTLASRRGKTARGSNSIRRLLDDRLLASVAGLGAIGVYLAVPISFSVLALWSGVLVRRGKWKQQSI